MKKKVIAMLMATAMVAAMAGCGSSDAPAGSAEGNSQAASSEASKAETPAEVTDVSLKVWCPQNQVDTGIMEEQQAAFAAEHPEWNITWTTEIVGEKVRQKSLKIIMQAIKARGFVVDKNNIKIKRDTNEVIMVAQKASGEKAEFRVFLDGKFIYDFRGYEGQACQKDIRPFMKDLEEVYGVHVTKQTEIWSNPDKISTMKYQAINTNKNKA